MLHCSRLTLCVEVRYSSYEVEYPFTSLRALIIEMMVLLIESDESVAAMLSTEMWRLLISWALKYAHNNIYHALFYRLIFAVLRYQVNVHPLHRIIDSLLYQTRSGRTTAGPLPQRKTIELSGR